MRYKQIGKSGLVTSNLTLGTMIFGEDSERGTPKKEALKIIDQYISEGGNHLDTADVYAHGQSEIIVGEAIKNRRKEIIVSTKVRFKTHEDSNAEGLSRHHIVEGVNSSLKRLNTDYIDLLYLHGFDPITPLEETIRTLEDLIKNGKLRYIGISNFKAWQLMKAQALTQQLNTNCFIAAQYQYSLVKRDLEYEFFDLLESEGIGLLPWGPLGGGFLTGKYTREKPLSGRIATTSNETEESWERRNTDKNWGVIDKVKELAKKYAATPSQISIAWIMSKSIVPSVILGVRTADQLADNLSANSIKLSGEDILALDELSLLPELYPYRMINAYCQRNL